MGRARYTRSPIVNAVVDYTQTNGNGGQRTANSALTTASDEYMILNFNYAGVASDIVNVGTTNLASSVSLIMANTIYSNKANSDGVINTTIYIGPSTTIYYGTSQTGATTARINFTGVKFKNQ
jgi:hypothetical protein